MSEFEENKIGKRLRELRGSRNIVDIAKDLKISPSAWSMYECGQRIPRDALKIRISDYFNKPIQEIFF